jgi:hypothetical protein
VNHLIAIVRALIFYFLHMLIVCIIVVEENSISGLMDE